MLALAVALISLAALPGCGSTERRGGEPHPSDDPLRRAAQLLLLGDIDSAEQAYREAARPDLPATVRGRAYLGLGRCALLRARTPEVRGREARRAVEFLERAAVVLEGTPDHPAVERALGEARLELDARDQAIGHFERALRYTVDEAERRRLAALLALLFERAGNGEAAQQYARAAGAPAPEYWRARLTPPSVEPPPRPHPRPRPPSAHVPRALVVHPRSEWRARRMRSNAVPLGRPLRITVHHTGENPPPILRDSRAVRAYLRRLQRHDQKNLGWADVGYHFLIDPRGEIWEGRPMRYQGAHAGNRQLNRANIGIAVIGNFDRERPRPTQLRALERLLRKLATDHRIPAREIYTHSEQRTSGGLADTACPGRHLSAWMTTVRRTLTQAAPRTAGRARAGSRAGGAAAAPHAAHTGRGQR